MSQCRKITTCCVNGRIGRCMLDEDHKGKCMNQWDQRIEQAAR